MGPSKSREPETARAHGSIPTSRSRWEPRHSSSTSPESSKGHARAPQRAVGIFERSLVGRAGPQQKGLVSQEHSAWSLMQAQTRASGNP